MEVSPHKQESHRTLSQNNEHLKHVLKSMHIHFPKFQHEQHGRIMNVNELTDEQLTFGARVADGVASAMGSWGFIIGQALLMLLWIVLNLLAWNYKWDPYPYILLNLAMSAQAAFATPLIMMSQNRQSAKDRLMAENDYKTDVKGEEEICHIMEHLDHQDSLILSIVQQLEVQHERIEQQHKDILQALKRVDPELMQRIEENLPSQAVQSTPTEHA